MEGNRPKRRKDKYNPYTIFEKDGQYYPPCPFLQSEFFVENSGLKAVSGNR